MNETKVAKTGDIDTGSFRNTYNSKKSLEERLNAHLTKSDFISLNKVITNNMREIADFGLGKIGKYLTLVEAKGYEFSEKNKRLPIGYGSAYFLLVSIIYTKSPETLLQEYNSDLKEVI